MNTQKIIFKEGRDGVYRSKEGFELRYFMLNEITDEMDRELYQWGWNMFDQNGKIIGSDRVEEKCGRGNKIERSLDGIPIEMYSWEKRHGYNVNFQKPFKPVPEMFRVGTKFRVSKTLRSSHGDVYTVRKIAKNDHQSWLIHTGQFYSDFMEFPDNEIKINMSHVIDIVEPSDGPLFMDYGRFELRSIIDKKEEAGNVLHPEINSKTEIGISEIPYVPLWVAKVLYRPGRHDAFDMEKIYSFLRRFPSRTIDIEKDWGLFIRVYNKKKLKKALLRNRNRFLDNLREKQKESDEHLETMYRENARSFYREDDHHYD